MEAASTVGPALDPLSIDCLQLNITRLCNQACSHCHVEASPRRDEMMPDDVLEAAVGVVEMHPRIGTVDVTGGAPELHPRFVWLVERLAAMGRRLIVRHNLTVTLDPHPTTGISHDYLPEFFARNGVEIVSSLPYHRARQANHQRGDGVFEKSIESLRLLNAQGYGVQGTGLVLNLVANPAGAYLTPSQCSIEAAFRRELRDRHGVEFTNLFALANMPVGRFAATLDALGMTDEYLDRLAQAFNPAAAQGVMCRSMISVGIDGTLFDCDFNQMLGLAVGDAAPMTVFDFDEGALLGRDIRFANHCLGCTAGAGSSCGGATAE